MTQIVDVEKSEGIALYAAQITNETYNLARTNPIDAAIAFERKLLDRGRIPAWAFERALHHLTKRLAEVDKSRVEALEQLLEAAENQDRAIALQKEPDWATANAVVEKRLTRQNVLDQLRSTLAPDWKDLKQRWRSAALGTARDLAQSFTDVLSGDLVALSAAEGSDNLNAVFNFITAPMATAAAATVGAPLWSFASPPRVVASTSSILLGMLAAAQRAEANALKRAPKKLSRWELRSSMRAGEDVFETLDLLVERNEGLGSGLAVVSSARSNEKPIGGLAKRVFDAIFASAILVLISPVMLSVAFAVKLTSPGPLLYAHHRVGRHGKLFRCLKFRTMRVDAHEQLQRMLNSDASARDEWLTSQMLRNDPRITPVGKFLRESSLDELPQLFNVLIGDMSLVGPRPITRTELLSYGENKRFYLRVRPGITGFWQVSGRSASTYARRVTLDRRYVENWSMGLDLWIMLRTIPAVFNTEAL